MLQAYVTPLLLAPVVAVHLAILATCVVIVRSAPSRSLDWQDIEPSWTHWGAFLSGWLIAALMTWLWLFVGSARYDAEKQMWYTLLLLIGFGVSSVACGLQIAYMRRVSLQWRGTSIRWREGSQEKNYDMDQFHSFKLRWYGVLHLRFQDGKKLMLDPYARNGEEFLSALKYRHQAR
jgi:small-conductance mechanosensitive channel